MAVAVGCIQEACSQLTKPPHAASPLDQRRHMTGGLARVAVGHTDEYTAWQNQHGVRVRMYSTQRPCNSAGVRMGRGCGDDAAGRHRPGRREAARGAGRR